MAVLSGMIVLNSCEKQEVETSSLSTESNIELPFEVSNDNGVLNFETKLDYELALDYLVELERTRELDKFETALGFDSYRSTFINNKQKMSDIQDDILATFLNPSNKVIIEQKMFEVNMPDDLVSVWEHMDCDLKSAAKDVLIGEFKCSEDVFSILEGAPRLKSSDFCDGNQEGFEQPVNYGSYRTVYTCEVDYIKAGLYYTLNARIKQTGTAETTIGLKTTAENCYFTLRDNSSHTYAKDESGISWERNFRPYWGLQRIRDYYFKVDFYSYYGGYYTNLLNESTTNVCQN